MIYVQVTRDQRGYETTSLLHSTRPGHPPRVLYWFRSAPGVRVGRSALDEDAIRAIEDQHPDIEFDWPDLLEQSTMIVADLEQRPERRRRPPRPREEAVPLVTPAPSAPPPPSPIAVPARSEPLAPAAPVSLAPAPTAPASTSVEPAPAAPNPLLAQLVGREISSRLRSRYADIAARIDRVADADARAALMRRAATLDPDRWLSSEAILHGIQHADALYEDLRASLPSAP